MNRNLIIVVSLGFIALVVLLTLKTNTTQQNEIAIAIPNNIDYYLKNTRQKSFKADGSIDFILNSDLLEHYKKEDKSLLINPDAEVKRKNAWRIQAQRGDFDHPKEIIHFSNKVQLDKLANNELFQVRAKTLLFNIQQDLVISKSGVKVKADNWHLNAKTMTLDMDKEIHQFTQVTARYRHDKDS